MVSMIAAIFILFVLCASVIMVIFLRWRSKNRLHNKEGKCCSKVAKKVYYGSMEEAVSSRRLSLEEADFQRELGEIIIRTDGKNHTSVLCHMVNESKKAETLAYIKFQVRLVGGKKRFAIHSIDTSNTIYFLRQADRIEKPEGFTLTTGFGIAIAIRYQLSMDLPENEGMELDPSIENLEYDKRNMGVNHGEHFFYYLTQDNSINSLIINNRRPDEIIMVQSAVYPDKPWYFIYYRDIEYKGDIMNVSIQIDEK